MYALFTVPIFLEYVGSGCNLMCLVANINASVASIHPSMQAVK